MHYRIAGRLKSAVIFLLLVLSCLPLAAQTPPQERIEEVRIVGNRRIQEETIRYYIHTQRGDIYSEDRLRIDYRALWNTGFFSSVTLTKTYGDAAVIPVFQVQEKPLVRAIEYKGYKSFKESDILEKFKDRRVGLSVDSQFDPARIPAAKKTLLELLAQNGRPLGSVEARVEELSPTSIKITFDIDEGPKVRIGDIDYEGNTIFDDGKLRGALKLNKERGLIPAFKGTDKYIKEKLEYDLNVNMLSLYHEKGYIQARVGDPKIEIVEGPRGVLPLVRKTEQQYYITVPIEEGAQYTFSHFEVKGATRVPKEAIEATYGFKPGDIVNIKKLQKSTEQLKEAYGQMGYLDMDTQEAFDPDEATRKVSLTINIEEGKTYTVNRIEFSGNTKTRDKVLRREFVLDEQQVYNSQLLKYSVLRLNQLGFFEKIEEKDYDINKDPQKGEVDILVKVKERGQQSIGFTGGVSGISGSFIGLNYSSNNFRGKGQRVDVEILTGTRTTNFMFSFTEPYLFDTKTSLGLSIFNQRLRFDTFGLFFGTFLGASPDPSDNIELFTRRSAGLTASLGYPFWTFTRIGMTYSFQKISVVNIDPRFRSFALNQLIGFAPPGKIGENALSAGYYRSELTPTFQRNTKNSYFNATQGSSTQLQIGLAGGALGGDFNILRPSFEQQLFLPDKWLSNRRHTWAFRFQAEHLLPYGDSTSVPFFERIFSGGEYTIRGFDIRSITPYALSKTVNKDANGIPVIDPNTGLAQTQISMIPVGGDTLGNFTSEYRIPVVGPLSVSMFGDIGTATVLRKNKLRVFGQDTDIQLLENTNRQWRASTGLEVQFLLPVVNAPFRLIFAYNPLILNTHTVINGVLFPLREDRTNIRFTVGQTF